jgi:hypothetical protein
MVISFAARSGWDTASLPGGLGGGGNAWIGTPVNWFLSEAKPAGEWCSGPP